MHCHHKMLYLISGDSSVICITLTYDRVQHWQVHYHICELVAMKNECISCIFSSSICSSLASFSQLGPSELVFWNWWLESIGQHWESQLLQQSMWCSNSSCLVFFFFLHFFQHWLHFTSASSLMSILSYFHSHFTPLDVVENEYTRYHSTWYIQKIQFLSLVFTAVHSTCNGYSFH